MTNPFHEANRRRWEAASESWARHADSRGIWSRCHRDPALALDSPELGWLSDIAGRDVAVLGSGDNQVVFALAGLGARVTSVDISQNQLDVARRRADILGLDIAFLRADVTELSAIPDASFELVYTGGHVAVWVSDIRRYYAEAARILRPAGRFIVCEYHPFRRLWKESSDQLQIEYTYFDRGPHRFAMAADVLCPAPGQLEQYEFHWTIADYISAVMASGCQLLHVEEYGDAYEGWEQVPTTGLPARLLLVARRTA